MHSSIIAMASDVGTLAHQDGHEISIGHQLGEFEGEERVESEACARGVLFQCTGDGIADSLREQLISV
jgi:hypothetical protein